jgi:endonuclease/exonuclease/phosphatase family metal-dependent hydrolase
VRAKKDRNPSLVRYGAAAIVLLGIKIIDSLEEAYEKAGGQKRKSQVTIPSTHTFQKEKKIGHERTSLSVMTINIAHGRKIGTHQLFQKTSTIKSNLNDVSRVLKRKKPDLVALQEADGSSAWSGNFDHVRHVARRAGFAYSVRGEHVKMKKTSYGTALLSMFSLKTPISVKFAPSPPTFSKGVVLSTITVPGYPGRTIDVASLHLDFARKSVRQTQVNEIIAKLKHRKNPLIIMGDFNCEWTSRETTLQLLADTLNLKAYRPYSKDMVTYPKSGRRLDWILISREFDFVTHMTLEDTISDHLGVFAEIRIT